MASLVEDGASSVGASLVSKAQEGPFLKPEGGVSYTTAWNGGGRLDRVVHRRVVGSETTFALPSPADTRPATAVLGCREATISRLAIPSCHA